MAGFNRTVSATIRSVLKDSNSEEDLMDSEVIHLRPLVHTQFSTHRIPETQELRNHVLFLSAQSITDFLQLHDLSVNTAFRDGGNIATPLLLAIRYRFKDIVQRLVSFGADINQEADDTLPLILAISLEKHQIAVYLLSLLHIDVNKPTASGRTALSAVLKTSNIDILQRLIKRGAKIPPLAALKDSVSTLMLRYLQAWDKRRIRLFMLSLRKKGTGYRRIPAGLFRAVIWYL